MFKIEVWIPPVRNADGRIVRAGHWKRSGDQHEEKEAAELMRGLASKGFITKADSEGVELRGHPKWFSRYSKKI